MSYDPVRARNSLIGENGLEVASRPGGSSLVSNLESPTQSLKWGMYGVVGGIPHHAWLVKCLSVESAVVCELGLLAGSGFCGGAKRIGTTCRS